MTTELREATAELRELARGLHPAILTRHGLETAIEALAVRAPFEVRLSVEPGPRPAEATEAAAYYVVAESLTNAARYAEADVVAGGRVPDGRAARCERHRRRAQEGPPWAGAPASSASTTA